VTKEPYRWRPPASIKVRHHRDSPMRPMKILTKEEKETIGLVVMCAGIVVVALWIVSMVVH
jgi:hypothetical protein